MCILNYSFLASVPMSTSTGNALIHSQLLRSIALMQPSAMVKMLLRAHLVCVA